jgi:hypothetical protein
MKYLKIQNDGVLDIRLVALMGGTTKASDRYKIGQFGTGLKYTLAFLYRNNLGFKIFAGEQEVMLHTETENIRNEDFEIICINGQRTSITTRMGTEWEAWMIVRELWSNALDEGGAYRAIAEKTTGEENKTTFYIQLDTQFQKVVDNWHNYFIHEQEPIFKNENYALYPAGDRMRIYKQGILIYEHKDLPAVFSYDMHTADINELREFRGSPSMVVAYCLSEADEKAVNCFLENVKETHYEGQPSMDFSWYKSFGQAWRNVIGTGKIITQKSLDNLKSKGNNPDESKLIIVPKQLYKFLTNQFEGIGAVYIAGKMGEFYENYDDKLESKIKQGLTILEACEYHFHPELTFTYGWFEDKTVLAQVNLKQKKVYVSQQLLQRPLFDVVSMLVEENEHFNTGMNDHTREFQQHFINLYTRELLAKNAVQI